MKHRAAAGARPAPGIDALAAGDEGTGLAGERRAQFGPAEDLVGRVVLDLEMLAQALDDVGKAARATSTAGRYSLGTPCAAGGATR